MKVNQLSSAPYNPRKINDDELGKLERSMVEFGDLSGIVFNKRTGRLIGGHQRTRLFDPDWAIHKKMRSDDRGTVAEGFIETPYGRWSYREVDWPEAKEKAANLAANKHGGEFDMAAVNVILEEISMDGFDCGLTGFELESFGGGSDEDNNGNNGPALIGHEYQIIVICCDERDQVKLIEEFDERGIQCRPLIL